MESIPFVRLLEWTGTVPWYARRGQHGWTHLRGVLLADSVWKKGQGPYSHRIVPWMAAANIYANAEMLVGFHDCKTVPLPRQWWWRLVHKIYVSNFVKGWSKHSINQYSYHHPTRTFSLWRPLYIFSSEGNWCILPDQPRQALDLPFATKVYHPYNLLVLYAIYFSFNKSERELQKCRSMSVTLAYRTCYLSEVVKHSSPLKLPSRSVEMWHH
jgi:hypothetical protein